MTNRKYFIDILRIIATFAVIMIHVVYEGTSFNPADGRGTYMIHIGLDLICQFAVPMFVILSGYLILNKENVTIKYGIMKALKLIVIYFLASIPYAFYESSVLSNDGFTLNSFIKWIFNGEYHLWFIPMISGLYLFSPIIKVLISKCEIKYIYYVLIIVAILNSVNMLSNLVVDKDSWQLSAIYFSNSLYIPYANYIWYFIAGYALGKIDFNKRARVTLYLVSLISSATDIYLSYVISFNDNINNYAFLGNFTPFTIINVIALFVFFKYLPLKLTVNNIVGKTIYFVSKATLPVYLVHVYFLRMLDHREIYTYIIENEIQGVGYALHTISLNFLNVSLLSFIIGLFISITFYLIRKLTIFLSDIIMSRRIIRETKKYLI